MIEGIVLLISFSAVGVSLVLCALRALAGPTDFDRALALDSVFLQCVALVLLMSVAWRTAVFYDLALVLALLGFIVTVAVSRHLGDRRDPDAG